MASYVTTITLVFTLLTTIRCKVYEPCELAKELHEVHEIPFKQISTWVCLARHESEYNTAAINHGSGDHGLFQISQLFWCSPPGYACGISCNDLHDDDIEDDVICARRIYREHQRLSGDGFNAWVVYHQYCKDKNYAENFIKGCDLSRNEVRNVTDLPAPDYFPQFKSRTTASILGTSVKIGLNKQGGKTIYPPPKTTQLNQGSKFNTEIKFASKTTPITKLNTGIKSTSYLTSTQKTTEFKYGSKLNDEIKFTSKSTPYNSVNTKFSMKSIQQSSTYQTSTNQQHVNELKSTVLQTYKPKITTYYNQPTTQKPTNQYYFKTTKSPSTNLRSSRPTPTKRYPFTNVANSVKTITSSVKNGESGPTKSFSYSINKTGFRFERTSL